MAISVLQFKATDPGTAATTTALTFDNPVLAGSTIIAVAAGNFVDVTGAADNISSSYAPLGTYGTAQTLELFGAYNVAGGASVTVTGTWASSTGIRPLAIIEVGGVAVSPLDGVAGNEQASPVSTSTDATTSGNATSAVQPALVLGLGLKIFNTEPNAGTGFTDHGAFWNVSIGGLRIESKRVTATGSQAATFTSTNTDTTICAVIVLDELVATGAGPLLALYRNRLVK